MTLFFENLTKSTGSDYKGTLQQASGIFTAMETCGSFLTGKTGMGSTKKNFMAFCQSSYMPTQYHRLAELLYELFRNGVSHSYIAKGAIIPTADPSAKTGHLIFFNQGLLIYVPLFAEDVQGSIKNLWEAIKKDEYQNKIVHQNQYWKYKKGLYWNYMEVFRKLDLAGKLVYDTFIKKHKIEVARGQFSGDINLSL